VSVDGPSNLDQDQRTSLAAERTWLAWWRTAIAATVGALGVGRLAPELLDTASGPYIALGIAYAVLAIAVVVFGAFRQKQLQRAQRVRELSPLSFTIVLVFTVGAVALAVMTIVLVAARS
jgi:uncharacterized membrane protein YidH (DUF202 family)